MGLAEHFAEAWSSRCVEAPYGHTPEPIGQETVVLVGRSSDEHLDALQVELGRRGLPRARIDVDAPHAIPDQEIRSTEAEPDHCAAVLCRDTSALGSLHDHRHHTAVRNASRVETKCRDFAAREATAATRGWLSGVNAPVWINEPWAMLKAEEKIRQLRVASRCGLEVPSTSITSSATSARRMVEGSKQALVYKCLGDPLVWEGNDCGFLYTSELTREHAPLLDGLGHPVLLQERLEVRSELRVTIVGDRYFAARIRSSDHQIDWRRQLCGGSLHYERCDLGKDLEEPLAGLMCELGLTFGAIDLAETDAGPVFLEVNSSGAYLWLERFLDMPITAAICDLCS